jgi:transcription elongation factor SPT4
MICTTTSFEGVIAAINPETSWVSRWQRTSAYGCIFKPTVYLPFSSANNVRGIYATNVKGRIPEDVEAELENRGIKYRPRDQTDQD